MESLSSETESNLWPQMAPLLDDAMGRLSARERDAIALRFFEDKNFQQIAAAVGASENAAKKRVGHALEKLRTYFSRRGLTSTTALIAGSISSNAVQTAPVTLAAPVILAAAGKGPAAAASTMALINATLGFLAWTKLRTALASGAALVLIAGTGLLATRTIDAVPTGPDTRLENRLHALEIQRQLLAAQAERLQHERDEATIRLAAVGDENARLGAGPTQAQLLRLRGQLEALRQELAASRALESLSSGGLLSQLEKDPALRSAMHQNFERVAHNYFGGLFHELQLTPRQTEQAAYLIADYQLKRDDALHALEQEPVRSEAINQITQACLLELEKALEPLFGEKGITRFKEFRAELPAQATVSLLNGRLGASQLSGEQCSRLVQLVKTEPFDLTAGITGMVDPAFVGTQNDIDDHLLKITESNERIVLKAGSFLQREQLSALSAVLSNAIGDRILSSSQYFGKH